MIILELLLIKSEELSHQFWYFFLRCKLQIPRLKLDFQFLLQIEAFKVITRTYLIPPHDIATLLRVNQWKNLFYKLYCWPGGTLDTGQYIFFNYLKEQFFKAYLKVKNPKFECFCPWNEVLEGLRSQKKIIS